MPDKQIFFDPQRKRWKRLRRIFDVTAVVSRWFWRFSSSTCCAFSSCLSCCWPPQAQLQGIAGAHTAERPAPARRKTARKPSEIPFNTGEVCRRLLRAL